MYLSSKVRQLLMVVPALLSASPSVASSFIAPVTQETVIGRRGPIFQHYHQQQALYRRVLEVSAGGSDQIHTTSNDESEDFSKDGNGVDDEPVSPPSPTVPVSVSSTTSDRSVSSSSKLGPKAPQPGLLRRSFPSLPWHQLPDALTYIRCLAIPALVGLFYLPDGKGSNIFTGVVFALASVTDWLDGYLARRWDISTSFGAFLDPVADKLMVSTSLILLAGRFGKVVAIPALVILAREIAVSALREWMAQRGERDVVKVGFQGKVKTALTMVALTMLLFVPSPTAATVGGQKFLATLYQPGIILLYLCALVTVTSGSVYFIAAGPSLLDKK